MIVLPGWINVFRAVMRGWRRLLRRLPERNRLRRASGPITFREMLATGVAFTLHSPDRRDDPTIPEEVRAMFLENRARFTSGVLFADLGQIAQANVVLTAHIIEESHDQFHHLIVVYPKSPYL